MTYRFCPLCAGRLESIATGPDAGRPGCPTGHFVHYANPAVTAFAFVEDEQGRFLILRRADEPYRGAWDMPGGFVEAGEDPADAVRREIREETALEVDELSLMTTTTSRYGDDGKWTVDLAFRCRLSGGDLRLSPEKSEHRWVPLDALPCPAFAGQRRAVALLRGLASRR